MSGNGRRKNLRELVFGRGFYLALVICLIASVAAIWAAAKRNVSTVDVNVTSQSDENAAKEKTTAPSRQTTTANRKTTTTTAPQISSSETQPVSEEPVVDTQVPYFSYYANPVDGRIIKYYTDDLVYSDTMNDYRTHNGVDYLANSGDSVKAINKGEVLRVYEDEMLGDVVEIDHAHGVIARYCGVKSELKEGDKVNTGDVIGTVSVVHFEIKDDTHVHLEILYGGRFVDPLDLMSKNGEEE